VVSDRFATRLLTPHIFENNSIMPGFRISIDLGEGYNDPLQFIECVQLAETYGFETVWLGDHFIPWVHSQNKSAFVWSVMPVCLDRTDKVKVGPDVTVPIGGRFHPAIIAQAAATIDNIYPGRFLLGVGSGEAMNEQRFMPNGFPKWQERIERLAEATELIRRLWSSEEYFDFHGKYFKMDQVFLYTKPKSTIPIYFSAIGVKAAGYAGQYGDNLVTTGNSAKECRDIIFPAFEAGARKSGKDPSKMEKMVTFEVYLMDKESGVKRMRETGEAGVCRRGAFVEQDPRKIAEMESEVSDEDIINSYCFATSPDQVIERVEQYRRAGATSVNICTHSFPENIRYMGEKILPHFKEK
jgi:coenzyme F420-dependent glucose-6-phosphate dehydrogenase